MRTSARIASAARRLRRLPKNTPNERKTESKTTDTESTESTESKTTESTESMTTETETEMKEKGSTSTIMRLLYGQNYSENEPGYLDGLDAADATKSLVKAASGYDQIEQSTMIKQSVGQGEVIIRKLDEALAGIARLERVLGTGGGGGGGGSGGSGGSSGGGGGCEGGAGGGGDGGSGDFGASPVDFDNPFV